MCMGGKCPLYGGFGGPLQVAELTVYQKAQAVPFISSAMACSLLYKPLCTRPYGLNQEIFLLHQTLFAYYNSVE